MEEMEGCGGLQRDVEVYLRMWRGVKGSGDILKDVEGCGRMWRYIEGCGRM